MAGKRRRYLQSGIDLRADGRSVQFAEKSHKLQNILETEGHRSEQTEKPMASALRSHMVAE